MGKKSVFAKGNVRHFKLVSRAHDDANADNPDASALVLEPFVRPGDVKRSGKTVEELTSIPDSLQRLGPEVFGLGERIDRGVYDPLEEQDLDPEAELEGDCYFPVDGYNYEQHLKSVSSANKGGGAAGAVLPAPKERGEKEEKPAFTTKGLLIHEEDKQAARTAEEAEMLRALEFDDEYDEMEDDDLEGVLASGFAEDPDVVLFGEAVKEYRDRPDMEAMKAAHKKALEANGFLAWSADGRRRREDADDLEEGEDQYEDADEEDFEAFLADEYGDEDIGACEEEDIEGHNELTEEVLDGYLQEKAHETNMLHSLNEPIKGKLDNVPRAIDETKALIERYYQEVPDADADDETTVRSNSDDEDESRNWDCETVLSTLSNVSNRPGKIGKIKVATVSKPKKDLPKVDEEEEESDEDVIELPDVITERKKDETAEEKKARKASVKEMRKVCRQMKKEQKEVYKNEAAKLPANQAGTGDLRAKQRYKRI